MTRTIKGKHGTATIEQNSGRYTVYFNGHIVGGADNSNEAFWLAQFWVNA